MKKQIKKIFNFFLRKFGLEINRRYEKEFLLSKYKELIAEHENCFKELIFKKLKSSDRRTNLLSKLYGTQVSEAIYLVKYLHESLILDGDVCEFGVANGATSALLANEIFNTNKKLWLFDSFKGLSRPTQEDVLVNDIFGLGSMEKYEGVMSYSTVEVKSRLKEVLFPQPRVKIVKGFIEEIIDSNIDLPQKVCFAYLDFDFYEPTATALRFLNKRLVKGGNIVVDDYNFFSKGAKIAVDQFLERNTKEYEVIFPYKFAGHFCILHKK